MKEKRTALYARVSTSYTQCPEMQLQELREFCERRGFLIVEEFVDKGISGSREQRPALDRLMASCRRCLVDAVAVYRYDRFARSLRQLVNALEEFRALGIDFISNYVRQGRIALSFLKPANRQKTDNSSTASEAQKQVQ